MLNVIVDMYRIYHNNFFLEAYANDADYWNACVA